MGRKRRGEPVHGWIVIDKPLGMGSTGVVGKVRYLLNAQKAGHGGTLDPLASGILPIALGEATKTVAYAMDGCKTYEFTARWGQSTATDDMEGEVVSRSGVRPAEADIRAILSEFEGEIDQIPPIYSAIKVEGKRAYDLARADIAVELKSRKVQIDKCELCSMWKRYLYQELSAGYCGSAWYMRACKPVATNACWAVYRKTCDFTRFPKGSRA
jgi:tRNA pseudouridine55 synthase